MADYICCECGLHFEEPKELDFGYICLNGPATGCPVMWAEMPKPPEEVRL